MISYDQPLKNLEKIFKFFLLPFLVFLLFNLLTGLTKITGLLFNLQLRKQFYIEKEANGSTYSEWVLVF